MALRAPKHFHVDPESELVVPGVQLERPNTGLLRPMDLRWRVVRQVQRHERLKELPCLFGGEGEQMEDEKVKS